MFIIYDYEKKENDFSFIYKELDKEAFCIIAGKDNFMTFLKEHKEDTFLCYGSDSFNKQLSKNFNVYDCKIKDTSIDEIIGYLGLCIDRDTEYPINKIRAIESVFKANRNVYEAKIAIVNEFNLPKECINTTEASIVNTLLDCSNKVNTKDDLEIEFVPTLKIDKYKEVFEFFKPGNRGKSLELNIAGVPHSFGWGGVHGANSNLYYAEDCCNIDVNSFYPSIMIEYKLLTRTAKNSDLFKQIYNKRIALKKEGKSKEQEPYKLILNTAYGISNSKVYSAYDPRNANNVCVNGQLLLLDLIEHLEPYITLIQTNTDGLIVKPKNKDKMLEVCREWESRTRMTLELKYIKEIYQKDVNNYLAVYSDGQVKGKGADVKEKKDIDYNMPIITEAITAFLLRGQPIDCTIAKEQSLRKFQSIIKLGDSFNRFNCNGELETDCVRVFASKNKADSPLCKVKDDGTKHKVPYTSEHCFVINNNINEEACPPDLDRDYYINLATEKASRYVSLL